MKRSKKRTNLKALVKRLLKKEFGDSLLEVRFWGPYEEEDLCADAIVKKRPSDWVHRCGHVYWALQDRGFDVLIGCEEPDRKAAKKVSRRGKQRATA